MYYPLNTWQFEFYLYSSNPNINSESTTNLEYAVSWLLDVLHINISSNNYIEIRKKIYDSNTQYIKEGVIFWEDGFIVKKLNFNDQMKTIYSPYDLSLFDKTHLSISYSNLIQKYNNNNANRNINTTQATKQAKPSNFKQINKLLDETNNILKSSNNNQSENDLNSDTDNESVSSDQLRELEENLDRMMNEQKELKNTLEEEKDKLADIIMEENYQKTLKAKEENKKKEKRNIFVSDLSVYIKLNKQNSKVPDFFMAKCVVFDFLDKNKYLETEDLENPSEELFELFTILYNSRFVDNYEPPEDFEEVVLDFLDSLPYADIITERDYHNKLNKITEFGMFSTDIANT